MMKPSTLLNNYIKFIVSYHRENNAAAEGWTAIWDRA